MLRQAYIDPYVKAALREDIGAKDLTTSALILKTTKTKADIEFKEKGILCGIDVVERTFRLIDEDLRFLPVAKDGEVAEPGREIAYIEGSASSILTAERTALNFLGHLSGIATLTREFVEKIKGAPAKIYDTRKTTPNLRILEKYAVHIGGAENHRFGLYDQALIKDNHLKVLRREPLNEIIARARRGVLKKTVVGVEVKNLVELSEVLRTRVDYILLDNMRPEDVREAVKLREKSGSKIALEVSGGVSLENVLEYARTGVERISVGKLTHAAPSIDVSLDIVA